jgi:hypothetical protein
LNWLGLWLGIGKRSDKRLHKGRNVFDGESFEKLGKCTLPQTEPFK